MTYYGLLYLATGWKKGFVVKTIFLNSAEVINLECNRLEYSIYVGYFNHISNVALMCFYLLLKYHFTCVACCEDSELALNIITALNFYNIIDLTHSKISN